MRPARAFYNVSSFDLQKSFTMSEMVLFTHFSPRWGMSFIGPKTYGNSSMCLARAAQRMITSRNCLLISLSWMTCSVCSFLGLASEAVSFLTVHFCSDNTHTPIPKPNPSLSMLWPLPVGIRVHNSLRQRLLLPWVPSIQHRPSLTCSLRLLALPLTRAKVEATDSLGEFDPLLQVERLFPGG